MFDILFSLMCLFTTFSKSYLFCLILLEIYVCQSDLWSSYLPAVTDKGCRDCPAQIVSELLMYITPILQKQSLELLFYHWSCIGWLVQVWASANSEGDDSGSKLDQWFNGKTTIWTETMPKGLCYCLSCSKEKTREPLCCWSSKFELGTNFECLLVTWHFQN